MKVIQHIKAKDVKITFRDHSGKGTFTIRPFATMEIEYKGNTYTLFVDSLEDIEKVLSLAVLEISAKIGARDELHRIPVQG